MALGHNHVGLGVDGIDVDTNMVWGFVPLVIEESIKLHSDDPVVTCGEDIVAVIEEGEVQTIAVGGIMDG